jgi:hypothetical protein
VFFLVKQPPTTGITLVMPGSYLKGTTELLVKIGFERLQFKLHEKKIDIL